MKHVIPLNSTSRSVVNASLVESKLLHYLKLTLSNDFNCCEPIDIDVFPGKSYEITYYNSVTHCMSTLSGYVYQTTANSIFMKVMKASKDVCLCRNKNNLNGLVDCFNEEIPINNISKISEWDEIEKKKPKYRGVTTVGILGISAELIQAIVLRLRIYEDGCICDKDVTPVDMVVSNTYHVTYCGKDHSIYEITGKLHKIDVVPPPGCGPCHDHGFVKEEDCSECVGENNTVYNAEHFYCLDKDTDLGSRVKLIFDTSTDFNECFDTVMLKDIRMVEEIKEDDTGDSDDNPPSDDTSTDTWCHHCIHRHHCHHHWHLHHHHCYCQDFDKDPGDSDETSGEDNKEPEGTEDLVTPSIDPNPDENDPTIPVEGTESNGNEDHTV